MLGIIKQSAQRQYDFARKLVLHFDLEAQVMNPTPAHGCNAAVTARAAALRASSACQRESDLKLSLAPAELACSGHYLADALAELIENAFKFSQTGQPVEVNGAPTDNSYTFTIRDKGPGFTAAELAEARPFTQFQRPGLAHKGLGLGLAIARSFSRVAGGTLAMTSSVDSNSPGLTVTLALPLSPAPADH